MSFWSHMAYAVQLFPGIIHYQFASSTGCGSTSSGQSTPHPHMPQAWCFLCQSRQCSWLAWQIWYFAIWLTDPHFSGNCRCWICGRGMLSTVMVCLLQTWCRTATLLVRSCLFSLWRWFLWLDSHHHECQPGRPCSSTRHRVSVRCAWL